MAVAAGGAFINFKLIALPMSEMVGAGDYLTATLRTSEVAALVIIFVEASMGLFLMEALRITHLFPRIANLNERMRRRMMWIALVLLVTLAGVEAALALMRDMLIADKQALLQSLATVQRGGRPTAGSGASRPPGQMLLGFILPFALAFIAIPLESLIHSARTVGGVVFVALVRAAGASCCACSATWRAARRRVLITLYDVAIVLPLLVERLVKGARPRRGADGRRRPISSAPKPGGDRMIKRLVPVACRCLGGRAARRAAATRAATRTRCTCWSTPPAPTPRRRPRPS